MAPAHEDNPNSYGGLGAGGKFRKHTSRRSANSKPYDRPPTALRSHINGDDRTSGGWLSKLVDPAQRLISASAHRLFTSVFRKRLPPPPPPPQTQASPQPSEPFKETSDEHINGVSSHKRAQLKMHGGNSGIGNSDRSGAVELEQTLKQKTFTRSEIDRLTALLHSRTADMPSEHEKNMSEMTSSKLLACEENGRLENTPVPARENGVGSHLASTPALNQSVLDEDVVSPTELAKAYMGSRISKASSNVLGGCSQASKDDTILWGNQQILQKSPAMSRVPRSSCPASASNNSLITPRSRGRSAIYSMARTPYARVNSRSTLKDADISVDKNARPPSSVSLSIWEQSKLSASKQGSLKRRSSVLDNDIKSVGPIRRIRQKPNLLSSRSLIQPAAATSMSAPRPIVGADDSQHPSSPMEKLPSLIEPKYKPSLGNGENGSPATNFARVPTKSSEMALKILQQLDKLVSPKEKRSPTQLSPSMSSGKALGSLEKVDSSRFMVNVRDCSKMAPSSMFVPASHDSNSPKVNKIEENGPKLLGLPGRVTSPADVLDTSVSAKDTALSIKSADIAKKSNAYNPQQNRAFQMSAPDDSLDWDDEGYPDGVALSTPAEDNGKQKVSDSDSKISSPEAITIQQPAAALDIRTSETSNTGLSDGTLVAVKNAAFTFRSASSSAAVKVAASAGPDAASSTPIFSFGGKVLQPTESNVSPIFSFGDRIAPVKEVNAAASTVFSSDSKNIDNTPLSPVRGQSDQEAGALPISKIETSNGLATTSAGVITAKHSESETTNQKSNLLSASPPTSAAGIFSFGASANGSFATATLSSTISSASPSNCTIQSASGSSAFTGSTPVSTSTDHVTGITAPSLTSSSGIFPGLSTFSSAPAIKFVSATVPSTMSSTVAITPAAESGDKSKHDTSFSNLLRSPFKSTSLGANTGSGIFGLAPVTSMTPSSQGSTPFSSSFGVTTSSSSTAQASSTGSGMATCSQSVQFQVGSSVSSPSFGIGGNSAFSSSSSLFGSSNGSTIGQSSLATSAEAKSGSSGGGITDMRGTTLQPGKSPIFGSTFSTNGFVFGASMASSTPAGASNAAPVVFGSSDSSLSSSSFVSVTSSAPPTLVQPTFGKSPAPSQPVSGNLSASSQPTFGNPSASRPAFGSSSASSQSPFASNSAASSQLTFGGTSAASLQSAFGGTSAASLQSAFGSTSAASSQPIFGGASTASQPIFGGTSSASQPIFGGTSTAFGNTSASSQPAFANYSISTQPAFGNSSTSSQPAFGNHSSGFPLGLASSGHNDQMSMEDTMAEDTVPAPAPSTSVFGQQSFSTQQTGVTFGSTAQSGPSPFLFGSQQNQSTQNPSPFQASGSLDFHAGGSFSLGSGGGDKSKRKIIKVKHKGRK